MSGLETRAARNVVIVATANKLARISWAVLGERERLSSRAQTTRLFQLDEVVFEIRFSEVCRRIGDENTVKRRA
jgi:hypothetical protein